MGYWHHITGRLYIKNYIDLLYFNIITYTLIKYLSFDIDSKSKLYYILSRRHNNIDITILYNYFNNIDTTILYNYFNNTVKVNSLFHDTF